MRARAIGSPVFACAGVFFGRAWTDVPAGFEDEARRNPLLEIEQAPAVAVPEPAPLPEPEPEPVDLLSYTVNELRQMADAKGLDWSGLKKAELIALLMDGAA